MVSDDDEFELDLLPEKGAEPKPQGTAISHL
jgi:hypothetical protein